MTQHHDGTLSALLRLPPYPSVSHALTLLFQAFREAEGNGQPTWEYAVEIGWLRDARVPGSTLRSLIDKGIIEHGYELHPGPHGQRRFRRVQSHVFKPNSSFVLAAEHVASVGQFLLQPGSREQSDSKSLDPADALRFGVPFWLAEAGELWFENDLVKIVPRNAQNQRKVLNAGQAKAWRQPIPNPFVISGDRVDPDTLHNSLDRLNRGQVNRRLHFHRDGSGRGFGFIVVGRPVTSASRSQLHPRGVAADALP